MNWYIILVEVILVTLLLLSYKYKGDETSMDRDLMASMFTAIQDFISEVFESKETSGTRLNVMELGDRKVIIEHGNYLYLPAMFSGGTLRLENRLNKKLGEIESEYGDVLRDWKGDMDALEGIGNHLEGLIS